MTKQRTPQEIAEEIAIKTEENRYITRTVEHIHRVQKNMVTLVTKYKGRLSLSDYQVRALMESVMKHDVSKFSQEQYDPYIKLQKIYDTFKTGAGSECKKYPEINAAVENHYFNESHHPEFWIKHGFEMTKLHFIEAACDLQAMAQEFGEGSFRKYYETKWWPTYRDGFKNRQEANMIMNFCLQCFEEDTQNDK